MYNNQYMLESLSRQKDRIDDLIRSYQQPQPVNNFISTGQIPPRDAVELRVLNENEEVDNLYVQTKTLFLSENMMVLKGIDGSLEKWEIKKVYPVDKKDEKINSLEEEIRKLKEVINEYTKPDGTASKSHEPDADANGNAESKPKGTNKPVSK